jgi:hypothetical protein
VNGYEEEIAQLRTEVIALQEALRQTADCLEDIMTDKGGWAWEEILQEARAALAADAGKKVLERIQILEDIIRKDRSFISAIRQTQEMILR